MLNEVRQSVTTCPGTGQVVTTPGVSCNKHDRPLGYYITYIIIIQGYCGTFRVDFSIFETLMLRQKLTNSAN